MSEITMSEVRELTDPKLRGIAKRALRLMQLEAEKAVAHHADPGHFPLPTEPNSGEHIIFTRFNELNATKKQAAIVKAMASINAPDAERAAFYGDLSKVALRSAGSVQAQAKQLALPENLKFPLSHLKSLTGGNGHFLTPATVSTAAGNPTAAPTAATKHLELRIHKVRCVDETNPEFWGDDEIALGGTTVDESGDVNKVSPFTVKDDFDDGEQMIYGSPKRFAMFSLAEGSTFPKSYFGTLVLSEIDMGGFPDFVSKLWEMVKGKVLELITAAIGGIIGSTIPGLGTIVGTAVGWVVGKFLSWLRGLYGDDVFTPVTVSVSIPSPDARWLGKTDSPETVVRFEGYGGEYDVTYDWRLLA